MLPKTIDCTVTPVPIESGMSLYSLLGFCACGLGHLRAVKTRGLPDRQATIQSIH